MASETPLSDVRFLTVAEVALIMRVSRMTVYRLVHTGELEAIRVGRSFRIPEAAVNQYLRTAPLGDQPYTPVRIYLAVGADPSLVESAVLGLLDAFGFQVERSEMPIMGSWFRRFWVQAKSASPPVEEQLMKLQRAIELHGLDRPQSEVDLNQADAVARLLGALDPENDALMQIGSLVLIKVESKVFVRTLAQTELVYFNRNPALFQDPANALQVLQQGRPKQPPPPIAADG
jgi:excisionase family DNA binding protein